MSTSTTRRASKQNWCYGCASRLMGIEVDLKGLRLDDREIARDLNYGRDARPNVDQSGMPDSAAAMTRSGSNPRQITA